MDAYIIDGTRTPFGRYGGALSSVRADDLAAHPIKALIERYPNLPWGEVDEVVYGAANQAGEDNRNVGRMAALLAGLPVEVPGVTVNRLCGSGLEAVAYAARAIKAGEGEFFIAGGAESMSRAPFVMGKADAAFSRSAEVYDTTIGWRFVNKKMQQMHGTDSMPETGRMWQKTMASAAKIRTLWRCAAKNAPPPKPRQAGRLAKEITPVSIPRRKGSQSWLRG